AALHLPWLRIALARARASDPSPRQEGPIPLGVVIARPGGAVKDERSLLGGTRLDEVSRSAFVQRVRRGDTIAAARAKCAELQVRVVAEEAVRGVLHAVAEAGLAFGRTASVDEAREVVCFDVTGCGHLFGGEEALARSLALRVRAMRHGPARVVMADGPRVASALVRAADPRKSGAQVIAPGGNAEAIRALPIAALPIGETSIHWLRKLGLVRIGDLQQLPVRGLATRLGAVHAEVMSLLSGDDSAPLDPYVPPEVPEERAELEYGIDRTEPLLFVVKRLCDRLAARLAGRAMAAVRLEVELSLDRAIARETDLPPRASLPLTLSAPLSTSPELFSVARSRVESWTIPAPILAVTLRVPELARKEGRALHLYEAEAKAEYALPRLVAELAADLGDDRVGTLALSNSWIPEERSLLVPFGAPRKIPPRGLLVSPSPEPSRALLVPLGAEGVEPVCVLARIEAVAWWRGGGGARDFMAGWSPFEGGMAWVEFDRESGRASVKGWMD
ncbi:MAG TPA: DNA polymerase Y family protein, partial [Polyangiaceae bacterium]